MTMPDYLRELAAGVSTTLLAELEDTSKATHQSISAAMGKYSQAISTREDERATVVSYFCHADRYFV